MLTSRASGDDPVSYNRDIRPLFSETCLKCHGPDSNHRKANLRLDVADSAYGKAKSGDIPIVPGDPEKSQLIQRITATDEDQVMPPPSEHKPLKPRSRWNCFGDGLSKARIMRGIGRIRKIQSPKRCRRL